MLSTRRRAWSPPRAAPGMTYLSPRPLRHCLPVTSMFGPRVLGWSSRASANSCPCTLIPLGSKPKPATASEVLRTDRVPAARSASPADSPPRSVARHLHGEVQCLRRVCEGAHADEVRAGKGVCAGIRRGDTAADLDDRAAADDLH